MVKYQYFRSPSRVAEDDPLGAPRTSGLLAGSFAASLMTSALGAGWGKEVKYNLSVTTVSKPLSSLRTRGNEGN